MKIDSKHLRRLVILSLFLLVLFSFIIIQFYKIQIVEGGKWEKIAKSQHQFSVIESFKRGRFFANTSIKSNHYEDPQALVFDVAKFHLFADPEVIEDSLKEEIALKISEIFNLNWEEQNHVHLQFYKKSRSRKLKMWIESEEKDNFQKWWIPYAKWKRIPTNALYFVGDFQRAYPYGRLLGAVLSTVRDDRSLETHQNFPTGGLELKFDEYLRGKAGKRLVHRSPRHPLESGMILSQAEDGADVYLTINHYLQAIVEEEIKHAVRQAGAKSGWAILMDPYSGEIYALGQYPSFDPSHYRDYYNDPKLVEFTKVRALIDCYEPGSVMKPISIAIAFLANEELQRQGKEPIFDPMEKIPTLDGTFPGRKKPIQDVGTHHYLNMYLAVQKSSNIYVAKLVQRIIETLGEKWYRDQLEQVFGFGQPTGIELPGESSGLLPKIGKCYASGRLQWSTPTPFSLAIGYNLLANSFQVLRAYAIIANGGFDVKPTVLRKIVKAGENGSEEILLDNTCHEKKALLNPAISRQLICALKSVTKPGGIGTRAEIPGYTEAGKTGTTEKIINGMYSKKHHFSTFIGFAPANHPKFVLLVSIDEPEYRYLPGIGKTYFGGISAGTHFSHIMERSLKYLGVPPDDPYGYPVGDPRYDKTKADWAEQVQILRKLYSEWNH